MVAIAAALSLAGTANAQFVWERVGGDPLFPSGLHTVGQYNQAVNSAKGTTALRLLGLSSRDIRAIKAGPNGDNFRSKVRACTMRSGARFVSMTFGSPTRVVGNVIYTGSPEPAWCERFVHEKSKLNRGKWRCGPWGPTQNDGYQYRNCRRTDVRTTTRCEGALLTPEDCGNLALVGKGCSSSKERIKRKKTQRRPGPAVPFDLVKTAINRYDKNVPLEGGEFTFTLTANGAVVSDEITNGASGQPVRLPGLYKVGTVLELCEQEDEGGRFEPVGGSCVSHTVVAADLNEQTRFVFTFVNKKVKCGHKDD